MKISNRVKDLKPSPIRMFTPYLDEAEKKGIKVYKLNSGQPDIQTPEEFFKPIRAFNGIVAYSRSQGSLDLLKSFESYYKKNDIDFKADEIVATSGGTSSIFYSLMITCDPGDNILIPEPFYTNYLSIATLLNIEIIPIPTKAENGYRLPNLTQLEKLITEKTRAILLSNPDNPTGRVLNHDEMIDLCQLTLKNNLFIIADEVYREFVYDNIKLKSFAQIKEISQNLILLDSISKRYSACGARIGCIASKNEIIIKEAIKISQTNISLPLLEQLGAANLINVEDKFLLDTKEKYEERRNLLYDEIIKIPGIKCQKPNGAFYLGVELPVKNASDFSKWLLTDFSDQGETIFITPMEGFYKTDGAGKSEVRIAYPIKSKDLKRSIEILGLALKKYRDIN